MAEPSVAAVLDDVLAHDGPCRDRSGASANPGELEHVGGVVGGAGGVRARAGQTVDRERSAVGEACHVGDVERVAGAGQVLGPADRRGAQAARRCREAEVVGDDRGRAGEHPVDGVGRGGDRAGVDVVERPILAMVGRVEHDIAGVVTVARHPVAGVDAHVDQRLDAEQCRRDAGHARAVAARLGIERDVAGADVDRDSGPDEDRLGPHREVRVGDDVVADELDLVATQPAIDRDRGGAGDHEVAQLGGLEFTEERVEVLNEDRSGRAGRLREHTDRIRGLCIGARPDLEPVAVAGLGNRRVDPGQIATVDRDRGGRDVDRLEPGVRDRHAVEHDRAGVASVRCRDSGGARDLERVESVGAAVDRGDVSARCHDEHVLVARRAT